MKKILLSAYACEPNRGSEPGLGWLWADEMAAKGWDVTVLTSEKRHGPAIRKYLNGKEAPFKIIYIDFPWPGPGEHVWAQNLHYFIWLIFAGLQSRTLKKNNIKFDWCQQITWASMRYPCFLAKNGKLILGPMGGTEEPNWKIVQCFGKKSYLFEKLRIVSVTLPHLLKISLLWLKRADVIALANHSCLTHLPKSQREKAIVFPAISLHNFDLGSPKIIDPYNPIKLLFVGRLLSWKGVNLILSTLSELHKKNIAFSCSFLGEGPELEKLQIDAKIMGIDDKIEFKPWIERNKTYSFYDSHDLFIFPSLHDSGGMVVLEAVARGLPVICLNTGGPPMFVDNSCGKIIPNDLDWEETVQKLSSAVIELSEHERYNAASNMAIEKAKSFQAGKAITSFWKMVEKKEQN